MAAWSSLLGPKSGHQVSQVSFSLRTPRGRYRQTSRRYPSSFETGSFQRFVRTRIFTPYKTREIVAIMRTEAHAILQKGPTMSRLAVLVLCLCVAPAAL